MCRLNNSGFSRPFAWPATANCSRDFPIRASISREDGEPDRSGGRRGSRPETPEHSRLVLVANPKHSPTPREVDWRRRFEARRLAGPNDVSVVQIATPGSLRLRELAAFGDLRRGLQKTTERRFRWRCTQPRYPAAGFRPDEAVKDESVVRRTPVQRTTDIIAGPRVISIKSRIHTVFMINFPQVQRGGPRPPGATHRGHERRRNEACRAGQGLGTRARGESNPSSGGVQGGQAGGRLMAMRR
jgi:hypothetical protein